ncbi:putative ankyrin repeat protein [Chloropicon roscoffensis]|uniref:Ankyrin repeat protein n=1 Tax=Chloropicon roscoffensis TaxID=1461544 RepID=A0AAX4PBH3_9CHLO
MGTASGRGRDEMARGAGEPSTKRAKVDEKEEEDPLVRRKEEVIRLLGRAKGKGKGNARAKKELLTLCGKLEAKNEELLRPASRLPPELWQKILDENVQQNDLLALAMTCRFFREKQKDLGKKMETELKENRLLDLQKSGKVASHTLGWFRWVCDTFEILPGFEEWSWERVKGAVYEGQLVNYAALHGSVEILRWLMEEKGFELNDKTGWWAGLGGSIEVFEHLSLRGYKFTKAACEGAAIGGHLEALKYLRGLDPPCLWDNNTCADAAWGGHLDVLKWLRDQDPPCPWDGHTCRFAAEGGHLEVLKWLRSQDPPCPWDVYTCFVAAGGGHLDVLKWLRSLSPPCPWSRRKCRENASQDDHQHIIDWIDQQEDESDAEFIESDVEPFDSDSDRSYDSYSDEHF